MAAARPVTHRYPVRPGRFTLPGREVGLAGSRYWRIERTLTVPGGLQGAARGLVRGPWSSQEARLFHLAGGPELDEALFLDLETCGFAGNPLFLVGCLVFRQGQARLVQLLARTYAEEEAVVRVALAMVRAHRLLVSFNGKSYDLPFLNDRAVRFGAGMAHPRVHFDLLHASRRAWRGTLPNCRLPTLEAFCTGRARVGDVSGSEAPERYHRFVRSGDSEAIGPIVHHNRLDLLALVSILHAFGAARDRPDYPPKSAWA